MKLEHLRDGDDVRMKHFDADIGIVFVMIHCPIMRVRNHGSRAHTLRYVLWIIEQVEVLQVVLAQPWFAGVPREYVVFVPAAEQSG